MLYMVSDLVFKCKSYAKRSKYDANVTKHWCATELGNTILCQNAVHLGIMLMLLKLKVKNWRWQWYLVIMMISWTFFRPRYDYCIHDNDDDRCSLLWWHCEPSSGPDVLVVGCLFQKHRQESWGKLGIRLLFLFFLCAWWWLHKLLRIRMLCSACGKIRKRKTSSWEEACWPTQASNDYVYSWWRGWYVVAIFDGDGGVRNDDDDEEDSCRLLTQRDVSRLRTHLSCNFHEIYALSKLGERLQTNWGMD